MFKVCATILALIQITQIMPNPEGPDIGNEFVIIKNLSESTLELTEFYLDDEDENSSPMSLEGIEIAPMGEKKVILEDVSLNNTKDELRLLDISLNPIETISFENAPEDCGLIHKESSFEWDCYSSLAPQITEIFPNPEGPDTGEEWVELFNPGTSTINLSKYLIDDGEEGSKPAELTGELPPLSFVKISSSINLNNEDDSARILLKSDNSIIESITYETTEEGKSFSKANNKWEWTTPTPSQANSSSIQTEVPTTVKITEVFPNPSENEQENEWIEIQNTGTATINLEGLILDDDEDGSKPYELPQTELKPGQHHSIYRSESGISLNNGEDKARILTPNGKVLDEVEYKNSKDGLSYQLTQITDVETDETQEKWQWLEPTQDAENSHLYKQSITVQSFESNLITTNKNLTFITSKLDTEDQLLKTIFQPDTNLEIEYETINGENVIVDFETPQVTEEPTVIIENTTQPLYEKLLPYIVTLLATMIIALIENRKGS